MAVTIFACAACSNKKAVYLIGLPENGSYDKSVTLELGFGEETKTDPEAEKTRQITIDGLPYTCEYEYTEYSPYYECDADVYKFENDSGFVCECKVSRKNGAVTSYGFSLKNGYNQMYADKSYEECKNYALFSAERVAGNGDYVLINEDAEQKPEHTLDRGDVYTFQFVKMAAENKTNVIVTVCVNTGGWTCSCDTGANQSYAGIYDVRGFMHHPDEADSKTIDKKIKSIYKSQKNKIKWEIADRCFARLKDGTFGIIYDIAVTTENGSVETVKLFKPDRKHT